MRLLGSVFAQRVGLLLDGPRQLKAFADQSPDFVDVQEAGGVPVQVRHCEIGVHHVPVRLSSIVRAQVVTDLFQPVAQVVEMIAQKLQFPASFGAGLRCFRDQVVLFSLAHGISLREGDR